MTVESSAFHPRILHALRLTALCDSIPSSLQRGELLAPPIEMLLRSCPKRRYLLLVISVTGVISVGVDNLEPVLHQAKEFVERFHQRVTLLFACLAIVAGGAEKLVASRLQKTAVS
jgi:hypothetical protein